MQLEFKDLIRLAALRRREGGAPVRRVYGIDVKAGSIDLERRTVRVIASTDTIDAYDDVVEQDWDFSRFDKNPVVLWSHNMVGFLGMGGAPEWTLPIGYASDYGVVNGRLEATLHFVDEKANPLAEKVWQGFVQKSIRAVSVGFYPRTVTYEKEDDREYYRLSDNELWEISPCPLPANPDAVALSAESEQEREWLRQRAVTNRKRAEPPTQENSMDFETMKAELKQVKDALAAKTAEVERLNSELAQSKTKLSALETEVTALKAANTNLQSALDQANTAKAAAETTLAEIDTKVTALDPDAFKGKTLTVGEKLAHITKSIEQEREKAMEKEVDELVGKKITPAQKASFLNLRKSNPAAFAEVVAGLPDLPYSQRTTPPESNPVRNTADGKPAPSTIAANALKAAEQARAS